MKSSFTGFLSALTPFAAAVMLAACCCESSSRCCDPCARGGAGVGGAASDAERLRVENQLRPQTVFQKLVVTNKHTKPVVVTPIGYTTDANGTRSSEFSTEMSLNPAPNVVQPGQSQTFTATAQNLQRIEVKYQESGDPSPFVESIVLTTPSPNQIRRCIVGYEPAPADSYTITEQCPQDPPN